MEKSTSRTIGRWLIFVLRLAVCVIFVFAGVMKLRDPVAFAIAIRHYKMVPAFLILPMAFYLPWLEIICGLSIFVRPLSRAALYLILLLDLVFLAALSVAWARGLNVKCGCFGELLNEISYITAITRNVFIAIAIIVILVVTGRAKSAVSKAVQSDAPVCQ